MTWAVIVNLRNGEEHTVTCETYRDALDIMDDFRQLMVFGFVDQEAIAQFDPDDLMFNRSYRRNLEPDTCDAFIVNPCEITSIDLWEVDE